MSYCYSFVYVLNHLRVNPPKYDPMHFLITRISGHLNMAANLGKVNSLIHQLSQLLPFPLV